MALFWGVLQNTSDRHGQRYKIQIPREDRYRSSEPS